MARADFTIADLEGGLEVGELEEGEGVYGAEASLRYDPDFGPGTIGRREAYITLIVAGMLFVYWRAARGY